MIRQTADGSRGAVEHTLGLSNLVLFFSLPFKPTGEESLSTATSRWAWRARSTRPTIEAIEGRLSIAHNCSSITAAALARGGLLETRAPNCIPVSLFKSFVSGCPGIRGAPWEIGDV